MAALIYNLFRFGIALVFVALQSSLMVGLFLEWLRDRGALRRAALTGGDPQVSVIIPVKDEAARMGGLLESLARQDYPRAEYIFIDDRSGDAGPAMLRAFAEQVPRTTIITLTENPGPNHKQYALSQGIKAARGDFFLFTDADCEIPPLWIRAMTARMADERTGITIGPVLKKPGGKGFFHLYQCFDHAVRYVYLAGACGAGAAGGGFGNNLIIRRETLDAIGGYDAVPPSPTEDAALVSRVRSHSAHRVRSACGADAQVLTGGERSWKNLVNQTLRWNNGGLYSPDPVTRFNFNVLMLLISSTIIAIPLLTVLPSLWPLPLSVLIVMIMNTTAALAFFGPALPKAGPLGYLAALVFTPMYFTFLTLLGYGRFKTKWKEGEQHEVMRTSPQGTTD